MNEKYYNIDLDYSPIMEIVSGDSLTASLFEYLTHKGLHVVKAIAPVVIYEHQTKAMGSLSLSPDNDLSLVFDDLYQYFVELNPKTVILYCVDFNYSFRRTVVFEGGIEIAVDDEPSLQCRGIVRFGVIQ